MDFIYYTGYLLYRSVIKRYCRLSTSNRSDAINCHGCDGSSCGISGSITPVCILVFLASLTRFADAFDISIDVQPVNTVTSKTSRFLNALMSLVQLTKYVVLHDLWHNNLSSFEEYTIFNDKFILKKTNTPQIGWKSFGVFRTSVISFS